MSEVPSVQHTNDNVKKNRRFFSIVMLVLALLSCLIITTWAKAQPRTNIPSYKVILTKDYQKKQRADKFHCKEKVFLAFDWLGLQGKHKISVLWLNPSGKQQDQIDLEFLTNRPKVENWVALKFRNISDPKNTFLPDFFPTNFNGEWQVKVFLDGNFLETLRFDVQCG